jgi:hypothetical protein
MDGNVGDDRLAGIGHPRLAEHLHAIIGLLRVADTWKQLMRMADRVGAAFLAISLRCSLVSFLARAGPPFLPPSRPSSTAAGFLPSGGRLPSR